MEKKDYLWILIPVFAVLATFGIWFYHHKKAGKA